MREILITNRFKKDLKKAEKLLMGSGVSGGILELLLAPIKIIENAAAGKPAFQGLGTITGGFLGLNDLIFPIKMIDNAVNKRKWDHGIFGHGKKAPVKRRQSARQKQRGALVAKIMKNYGMSLIISIFTLFFSDNFLITKRVYYKE